MTLVWPCELFIPQAARPPFLQVRALAGATSVSGRTQVSATDAGSWTYQLGGIVLHDRQTILAWRALSVLLEGRLNAIDVPLQPFEALMGPAAAGEDSEALLATVSHDDGSLFDDGSGYAGGLTEVALAAGAALRATSLTASIGHAPDIQPGQIFSITHEVRGPRWYQVRTFDAATSSLTFRPPLREAAEAASRLEFDRPLCRMRLAADDTMAVDMRKPVMSVAGVTFVEDL
jgi:hypothetical protein